MSFESSANKATGTSLAKSIRFAHWSSARAEMADVLQASIQGYKAFRSRLDTLHTPRGLEVFLSHAQQNAPFYRDSVASRKELSLTDFPLTNRDLLHDHPLRFLAVDPKREWLHPLCSSGTTKGWLTIYCDRASWYGQSTWTMDALAAMDPSLERQFQRNKVACVNLVTSVDSRNTKFYLPARNLALYETLRVATQSTFDAKYDYLSSGRDWHHEEAPGVVTPEEHRAAILRLQSDPPPILLGRPGFLRSVMKSDREFTGARIQPRALVSSGGVLYEDHRAELEDWFGCPVYNQYALAEAGVVALGRPNTGRPNTGRSNTQRPNTQRPNTQRPNTKRTGTEQTASPGLWVTPFVRLSVLKPDGFESDIGTGELIATNLLNQAMPLIRYRTGDQATVEYATDSEGQTRQVITALPGRTASEFTAGARTLAADELASIFHRYNIPEHQIIQWDNGAMEARWRCTEARSTQESVERELREVVHERLGQQELTVRINEPLHMPRGKFCRYINLQTARCE